MTILLNLLKCHHIKANLIDNKLSHKKKKLIYIILTKKKNKRLYLETNKI